MQKKEKYIYMHIHFLHLITLYSIESNLSSRFVWWKCTWMNVSLLVEKMLSDYDSNIDLHSVATDHYGFNTQCYSIERKKQQHVGKAMRSAIFLPLSLRCRISFLPFSCNIDLVRYIYANADCCCCCLHVYCRTIECRGKYWSRNFSFRKKLLFSFVWLLLLLFLDLW